MKTNRNNGEEFLPNPTNQTAIWHKLLSSFPQTAQQFLPNCSAVSPKLLSRFPKLLSSLVSSFTKLLSSLAKLLSSLAKSSAVSPNCWAVCGKLLSSLVKLLAKLLMILVKNLYFWHEINTFLIHKIIWAQMKTCYNLPVCGHQSEKKYSSWRLSEKHIHEPFVEIRKNLRETADQTTCFQRPWQFSALLFSNKFLQ